MCQITYITVQISQQHPWHELLTHWYICTIWSSGATLAVSKQVWGEITAVDNYTASVKSKSVVLVFGAMFLLLIEGTLELWIQHFIPLSPSARESIQYKPFLSCALTPSNTINNVIYRVSAVHRLRNGIKYEAFRTWSKLCKPKFINNICGCIDLVISTIFLVRDALLCWVFKSSMDLDHMTLRLNVSWPVSKPLDSLLYVSSWQAIYFLCLMSPVQSPLCLDCKLYIEIDRFSILTLIFWEISLWTWCTWPSLLSCLNCFQGSHAREWRREEEDLQQRQV